jgi:hypothetical protein
MRPANLAVLAAKAGSGRAWLIIFALILVAAAAIAWLLGPGSSRASAAPDVFASPIQGSCYLATPTTCKLKVDPFTINVAPAERLKAFSLQANGLTVYDFRSDVSNPPSGPYTPSLVRRDFAARCGESYVLNLLAMDTGDSSFLNAGLTDTIVCPEGDPEVSPFEFFLPILIRSDPGR